MTKKIKKSISYVVMILSWLTTIFIVADVNISGFQGLHEIAVWILFIFLGIGVFAFFTNNSKLILNEFACAAVLCVFLKSASNSAIQMPVVNDSTHFSVGHINLSSVETGFEELTKDLKAKNLDIISFQELKPDWAKVLKNSLAEEYPYFLENVRIDLFGMSVYSKFPILFKDTVLIDNIPFLVANIAVEENRSIAISNPLIVPSIDATMDKTQESQMDSAAVHIKEMQGPKVVMGDFNMVYWSSRIRDFRSETGLLNSRRDISQSVLSIPYDHIFYSEDLECTKFLDLIDSSSTRLGIQADFQFSDKTL